MFSQQSSPGASDGTCAPPPAAQARSAVGVQRRHRSGSHSRAAAKHGHARVRHCPFAQAQPAVVEKMTSAHKLVRTKAQPRAAPGKRFAHDGLQLQSFSQKFPSVMQEQEPTLQFPSQLHGLNCAQTCGVHCSALQPHVIRRVTTHLVLRVSHAPAHSRRGPLARRGSSFSAARTTLPPAAAAVALGFFVLLFFSTSISSAQALRNLMLGSA